MMSEAVLVLGWKESRSWLSRDLVNEEMDMVCVIIDESEGRD